MPSEPAAHGYKRSRYFIKKEFQFQFILKFCLVILAGAIFSSILLFYLSQGTLTTTFTHSTLEIKKTAFAILPEILLTNLITLAIIAIAAIFVTLYISHKIAGPMYRYEKEIQQITDGQLTHRVTLRNKDQITEIADQLNLMITSIHDKVQTIRDQVDDIQALALEKEAPGEIVDKLNHLKQMIDRNFNI